MLIPFPRGTTPMKGKGFLYINYYLEDRKSY